MPYLKALTLFAKGDTWHGGGLFLDERSYLVNELYASDLLFDHSRLAFTRGVAPHVPYADQGCLGVYYFRLLRDGWKLNERRSYQHIQAFEKPWTKHITLRKYGHHGKGPRPGGTYTDSHALLRNGEEFAAFMMWEWADVVGERLLWAEAGKLFSASASSANPENPIEAARLVHDFNDMKFEAVAAPY